MAKLTRSVLVVLVPLAAGCSISASIESSSKIVSSPFESSSSSSKSAEARYRDDVRDHTVSYVRNGTSVDAFRAELAEVARQRGITDWEANDATWEGIGEGLAKADVEGADFEAQVTALTNSDPHKMAIVRAAHERATE